MNVYFVFGLVFLAAALVGVLLSLIVLLPPIHRAGSQNIITRRVLIGLFSVLAFVVVFVGGTRLYAGVMVRTISDKVDKARGLVVPESQGAKMIEAWDQIKGDVLTELWLRQLFPDQGFPCRSGKLAVCEQMGSLGIFGIPTWGSYALYILVGLVSAVASGLSVRTFTLQAKVG
jgi:hypothetical protein